jgi:hypothetical protein
MCVRNVLDQFELKLIQILLRPEKKMYSRMAIGRNDNYVQRTVQIVVLQLLPKTSTKKTLSTFVTPKTISCQNQKNQHNTTTVWYSKYIVVCTTNTYFPPEQKTDTTAQLEQRFHQPTRSK